METDLTIMFLEKYVSSLKNDHIVRELTGNSRSKHQFMKLATYVKAPIWLLDIPKEVMDYTLMILF